MIVVPGPDMVLITRQLVTHGRNSAFWTFGGLFTGGLVHLAATALGVSAVLLASTTAFTVLKVVGAGYLLLVGVQVLRHALRHRRHSELLVNVGASPIAVTSMRPRTAYTLGVASSLTNPKVAIFFLTFIPQFVTPGSWAAVDAAVLSALFIALASVWWTGYILLLDRLGGWLRHATVQRGLECASGVVLIALALSLAA